MAFRDEPTAGVDHKFTSVSVVPSVDHLSGFTCRGLGMQRILRGGLNKIHTLITFLIIKKSLKAQICCVEVKFLSKHTTAGWCNHTVVLKIRKHFYCHGSQPRESS